MKKVMLIYTRKTRGFTIIELLIVIVIIAILAAITLVAYSNIQNRANDSRRAQDLASIKSMLLAYEVVNGGVPKTIGATSYASVTYSGWDASNSPTWLAFLRPSNSAIPVDPVNTITSNNNPPGNGNFDYFYYCYTAGSGPLPATDNVRIGYHSSNGLVVTSDFAVDACL